jgi:prepilin-type N-terminal cleavage/methylation domain-containing protein/prepilin-type processing-associated H-X9-DG protein
MVTKNDAQRILGFTLIELLVVVAIIAMLISILLPSLANARDQAKAAVCLSRLKNLGTAGQSYQTQYQGYIPGAPMTTGYGLAVYSGVGSGAWKPGMPMNIYDYSIPLLKEMSQQLPRVNSREAFYRLTTAGPFECPSNNQVAIRYDGDAGVIVADPELRWGIRATSYLTMSSIMRAGAVVYNKYSSTGLLNPIKASDVASPSAGWEILPPKSYMPRVEAVGRASMKVFLADGLRFYDGTQITYNTSTKVVYGYQSAQPPCDVTGTSLPAREYNLARKFSYRHRHGEAIQAVMFDGHAESLWSRVTQKDGQGYASEATGPAVHPKYYWPSGSVVYSKTNLLMRNDPVVRGWSSSFVLP